MMEATYQVLGANGATYGPVNLTQLQTWISEGRVNATTQLLRSDQSAWINAAALPETGLTQEPGTVEAALPAARASELCLALDKRTRAGASWFFWIAGLSLINSIVLLSGSDWGFVLGLGVTQIIDVIARELGNLGKLIGFILDLGVAGTFVFLGWLAYRRQNWAFILGMVLYLLDGLIFLLVLDLLALGFHAFALFCIFQGLKASRQLQGFVPRPAAVCG